MRAVLLGDTNIELVTTDSAPSQETKLINDPYKTRWVAAVLLLLVVAKSASPLQQNRLCQTAVVVFHFILIISPMIADIVTANCAILLAPAVI